MSFTQRLREALVGFNQGLKQENNNRIRLTLRVFLISELNWKTTVVDLAMRGKLLSPAGGDGDGGSAGRNGGTRNVSLCSLPHSTAAGLSRHTPALSLPSPTPREVSQP